MAVRKSVLLLLTLVSCTAAVNLGVYDCPSPWVPFTDACYKFELFRSPIALANQGCKQDGAQLVSVNSLEEDAFIEAWLSNNAKQRGLSWFTSGTRDRGSTGPTSEVKFTWSDGDGTEVTGAQLWFSEAARAQPGNRIVYYTDGSTWGLMVVNDQNITLPYICEIKKTDLYKISKVERGYDYGLAEIDPVHLPMGPSMTKQPRSTIYDKSSTIKYVIFNCEASANPLPDYTWYVIHDQKRKPVNLTDQSKTVTSGRLTIQSPNDTTDNGDYQCHVQNTFGSILSDFASLTFGYLNDFPKSQRDPVRATAHTGINIQCYPPKTGYSTISYTWYKESFLNLVRSSVKWYLFVSSDGALYFQSVTRDDTGEYFCVVTRPNAQDNFQEGKVSMPIPLEVTDSVGSQQDPEIVNGFPKAFPSSPMVGDTLRLECVAYGTEELIYKWSRIGEDMPTGAVFSDYNRVMTIANVQLAHEGTYRCTVTRVLGQETYEQNAIRIEAAPYFTIPIKNQFVDAGTTAVFRCYAHGVPAVTYFWLVNSTALNETSVPPADRHRYTFSNNILTITDVQEHDAGMYQCGARNTHGLKMCSAELRAFAFAPSFRKYPLPPNIYGTVEGNVTLICWPEAAPQATKEWFKDGIAFSGGNNVVMLPNGNIHFNNLQETDGGNYSCQATNVYGTASTSGVLTVLPKTIVTYPPRDTVVRVNQTTFFACQSSYNPAIDVTYDWWHNNYKIMFIKVKNLGNTVYVWREANYERGTGINRGALYITGTQFYHAGEYRCVVKSTTDEMTVIATLTVTGPPGEPAGVYGDNAKKTSIELSFWPSKDNGYPVEHYIVESFDLAERYWYRNPNNSQILPPADQTIQITTTVTGLKPYTQYKFRAIGVNAAGEGIPSQDSPIYRTTQAPPVTYPLNLGGGGGKVGTLNISWDAMPMSEWNADRSGVGYYIYWKKEEMEDDQWDVADIKSPLVEKYVVTIGADNYYLPYNIKIQSYNPAGVGPVSPVETIMSAEDIPKGVPIGVKAVYYNATAITVEWIPVDDTREVMKGVLYGYRINYWIDGEQNETMALFKIIRNQTDHGLIIALRENTYYMINVQAVNTAGNGPKSEDYRTQTLRAAPMEAPQDVRVSFVDYQSVLVEWRGVYTTIREEPLEGYIVRYWLRGENIYVATNLDAGKAIRYILSGLKQLTMYQLRVYGYSRGGDGLQSSPTLEFVLGSNCDITEDSPDKEYVYTCPGCKMTISMLMLLLSVVGSCLWRLLLL